MYCVADHSDAINAAHRTTIPICDRMFISIKYVRVIVSGVINVVNTNSSRNADNATICSVVLIFPIEKRALGTGISIFWVPRNSRGPLMYNSRAIIIIIGMNMNHTGIMMESFLEGGNQPAAPLNQLVYGKSITDPCLGWEASERLISDIAEYE